MNYILIDAGNSCLKLSIRDESDNIEIYFNIFDYNNLYETLVDQLSNFIISNVVISNVNKPLISNIISDVTFSLWNIEPYIVITQQNKYGISTIYKNFRLLGSDRWLTLIAAKHEYDSDICIIDCGSAVTVDVLTKNGKHLGGFITPGLNMSREALGLNTGNLPIISSSDNNISNKSNFLATNTRDAISAGTLYQLGTYLEKIISEVKNEVCQDIKCIITGGDAIILQKLIAHHLIYREKLVLDGLDILAKDLFVKDSL